MNPHVEPTAAGEGLQQHEEADRECTALWRASGGGCQWFQVSGDGDTAASLYDHNNRYRELVLYHIVQY